MEGVAATPAAYTHITPPSGPQASNESSHTDASRIRILSFYFTFSSARCFISDVRACRAFESSTPWLAFFYGLFNV